MKEETYKPKSEMLKMFMRNLKAKNRSKNTIVTLEQSLFKAEMKIGLLENASYEDLLSYIEGLKPKLSCNTISLIQSKLVQFYNYCFEETDKVKYSKLARQLKNINPGFEKSHIKPSDLLLPEDIKNLINVATLERDRCIIATLFESGMRRGELLSLTNDMVKMDDEKQRVTFEIPDSEGCKTGSRIVLCSDIYGYVQDWLKCNTSNRFMPLSNEGLNKCLIRLFKRSGIKKPSNPHNFRHSAITYSVNIGMQQNAICLRFWGSTSSDMIDTYIHLSETMQSEAYLKAKGMAGNEIKVINPLASRCINCGRLIQSGQLCITCKENAELKQKVSKLENLYNAMVEGLSSGNISNSNLTFDRKTKQLKSR
jgi:site-specific recombinase XerD